MDIENIDEQVLRDLEKVLTPEQKYRLLQTWKSGDYEWFLDESNGDTPASAIEDSIFGELRDFIFNKVVADDETLLLNEEEASLLAAEVLRELEEPGSSSSNEIQRLGARHRASVLLTGYSREWRVEDFLDWKDLSSYDS